MKNKISKTLFLVISLFLLCNAVIYANDTYLGSVGGNAFNTRIFNKKFITYNDGSKDIQMVKEYVHITIGRNGYNANCRFWFYNSGPKQYVCFGSVHG